MESTISAAEASPSSNGFVKHAIAFLCERLSLAVVAIGTVIMIIVFVVVEGNSTKLGFFPILFQHNDNVVQVEAGSSTAVPLQDRRSPQPRRAHAAAAFRAGGRSARENDDPGASHARGAHLQYGHYGEPAGFFRARNADAGTSGCRSASSSRWLWPARSS